MNNKERAAEATGARAGIPRRTVTFEPYFWEAYNEIVRPDHRYWYFVRRWLPVLSGNAVKIIMALRGQLYFNPRSGELRNVIDDLDLRKLAELTGLSVKTLTREFKKMECLDDVEGQHLKAFFSKAPTWAQVGQNRFQQRPNTYYVAMDDPIHPDDREWYEVLREQKERDRLGREVAHPGRKRVVKDRSFLDGQIDHQDGFHNGQPVHQEGQSVLLEGQTDHQYNKVSLPFSIKTTAALPPQPNGLPPKGEEECPLTTTWNRTLDLLAGRVNKPTLEAHLRPLRVASIEDDGNVLLLAPHASTRDWIEKRHVPAVAQALGEVLGRAVTVRLRVFKDLPGETEAGLGAEPSTS